MPVYVITHIDIIPTNMEAGRELLLRYAADIRDEPVLTRFGLLRQLHRPSHFETLAVWESEAQYAELEYDQFAIVMGDCRAPRFAGVSG